MRRDGTLGTVRAKFIEGVFFNAAKGGREEKYKTDFQSIPIKQEDLVSPSQVSKPCCLDYYWLLAVLHGLWGTFLSLVYSTGLHLVASGVYLHHSYSSS
jgi:hypothetical protein